MSTLCIQSTTKDGLREHLKAVCARYTVLTVSKPWYTRSFSSRKRGFWLRLDIVVEARDC